jgi:hypothetical protein
MDKTSLVFLGADGSRREELEGNDALELRVLGLVNHSHPALTEFLEDLVVGYGPAGHFALQQVDTVVGKARV